MYSVVSVNHTLNYVAHMFVYSWVVLCKSPYADLLPLRLFLTGGVNSSKDTLIQGANAS